MAKKFSELSSHAQLTVKSWQSSLEQLKQDPDVSQEEILELEKTVQREIDAILNRKPSGKKSTRWWEIGKN
jgi:hypothetical protein